MNKTINIGIISVLVIVLFLIGCSPGNLVSVPIQKPTIESWDNPTISCGLNNRETPIKQYPHEIGLTDEERNDPEGLSDFCSRMESRFENSEVTIGEANEVYDAIFDENIIRDESYGMPSPDTPPRPELTLEDIKERVKIKKIDGGKYEIFYKYTSCGTNYEHESIDIQDEQISNRERIEAWSGSYPC